MEPTSSNWVQSNQTEFVNETDDDSEFKISKVYDISISKNKAESKKSVIFENTLTEAAHF